jgi:hypothetical protein
MELSTRIVLHLWAAANYEGVVFNDPTTNYRRFTQKGIEEWMEMWVRDNADEDFDSKAFVILATKGIRDGLDWKTITETAENWAWRFFVEDLFRSDDEADSPDYDQLWTEIKRDTKFVWG